MKLAPLNSILLAFTLVPLLLGCGSSKPPLPTGQTNPEIQALVDQGNKFLDQVEALPPAERQKFLQEHAQEFAALPTAQPEIQKRIQTLLGQPAK